jgi:hypothetical protein
VVVGAESLGLVAGILGLLRDFEAVARAERRVVAAWRIRAMAGVEDEIRCVAVLAMPESHVSGART